MATCWREAVQVVKESFFVLSMSGVGLLSMELFCHFSVFGEGILVGIVVCCVQG